MYVTCPDCQRHYDDAQRWTICPHPGLDDPTAREKIDRERSFASPVINAGDLVCIGDKPGTVVAPNGDLVDCDVEFVTGRHPYRSADVRKAIIGEPSQHHVPWFGIFCIAIVLGLVALYAWAVVAFSEQVGR